MASAPPPSPHPPVPAQQVSTIQPVPCPLHEGQSFASFREFKDLLADWSIKAKFVYRIRKSDTKRVIAGCANRASGCPFHVRAYFCHKRECVVVGTLKAEHTCSGVAVGAKRAPASKQSWLQRVLPSTIVVTKETTPQQIIDAVQSKFQQVIRYEAAIRAKKWALQNGTATQLVPDDTTVTIDGVDGMGDDDEDPSAGVTLSPQPHHQLPLLHTPAPPPPAPAAPSPKDSSFPPRAVRIALVDPSPLHYPTPPPMEPDRYPWRGPSVTLRYGMIRAPTLREICRVVRRHIPEPRYARFLTGALDPSAFENGTVTLNDDDDTEAWLTIASGNPLELQAVLNAPDAGGASEAVVGERKEVDVGVWVMETGVSAPNGALATPTADNSNARKRKRMDTAAGHGMNQPPPPPPPRIGVMASGVPDPQQHQQPQPQPPQPRMINLDRLDPRITENQGNGRTLLENLGAAEARSHLGIV